MHSTHNIITQSASCSGCRFVADSTSWHVASSAVPYCMRVWPLVVSLTIIELRVMAEKTYGAAYKKNVMFLCNHNSCRSQMADGWLRALRGDRPVGVASAGIVGGTAVKPGAITVMKESGVDISGFTSDAVADFDPKDFDVVVSCRRRRCGAPQNKNPARAGRAHSRCSGARRWLQRQWRHPR